jgi:phosphoketolase
VRANYRNVRKGIEPDNQFLVKFFRNLLMGEKNELKNRFMIVNPPETGQNGIDETRQVTGQVTGQAGQVHKNLQPSFGSINALILQMGEQQLSVKQLMEALRLKGRDNFLNAYLNPAIKEGFVTLLYPESPRHPRQKYYLTVKGIGLYHELK